MTSYSLSFFATGSYDKQWWDKLTPDIAERAARRARAAGCVPHDAAIANYMHGIATAWSGPDMGTVLTNLKRLGVDFDERRKDPDALSLGRKGGKATARKRNKQ